MIKGRNAIIGLRENDILKLRKPHPCGSQYFLVRRPGVDVTLMCIKCGGKVKIPRVKLEYVLVGVIKADY